MNEPTTEKPPQIALVAERLGDALGARVETQVSTGRASWYRVGGPAAVWVEAGSVPDLTAVSEAVVDTDVPIMMVGEGSNLLVAEAGYQGVMVHLDRGGQFGGVAFSDGRTPGSDDDDGDAGTGRSSVRSVTAGAAVRLPDLARWCAERGHATLSWMAGIPGSVGGAVRMNAGVDADTTEVRHSLLWAEIFDLETGSVVRRSADELGFAYRSSAIAAHQVVTAARFTTAPGDPDQIRAANARHLQHRQEAQETKRTGGSVFTNPPGDAAWRLIADAGGKGLREGTAHVSDKHANFIVADRGGRADDVFDLMVKIRNLVHQHSGVVLEAETVLVGFPPLDEVEL